MTESTPIPETTDKDLPLYVAPTLTLLDAEKTATGFASAPGEGRYSYVS